MTYEYDSYRKNVLIRNQGKDCYPEILHKGDKQWSRLYAYYDNPDDMYVRAVYLGQGCWEDMDFISEEEAEEILRSWGYNCNPPEAPGVHLEKKEDKNDENNQ
ncbi:MAG: hypothetical protein IJK17_03065 [Lachnospiraceae bacterium]|nr:hypothetical protein [Lachnospiraceae bacterium]